MRRFLTHARPRLFSCRGRSYNNVPELFDNKGWNLWTVIEVGFDIVRKVWFLNFVDFVACIEFRRNNEVKNHNVGLLLGKLLMLNILVIILKLFFF